jgi:hypothetical protein
MCTGRRTRCRREGKRRAYFPPVLTYASQLCFARRRRRGGRRRRLYDPITSDPHSSVLLRPHRSHPSLCRVRHERRIVEWPVVRRHLRILVGLLLPPSSSDPPSLRVGSRPPHDQISFSLPLPTLEPQAIADILPLARTVRQDSQSRSTKQLSPGPQGTPTRVRRARSGECDQAVRGVSSAGGVGLLCTFLPKLYPSASIFASNLFHARLESIIIISRSVRERHGEWNGNGTDERVDCRLHAHPTHCVPLPLLHQ